MLTNFGKALRKMRIDHGEFMRDMAAKLGVTVAYLSAVENGKREVPDSWIEKLSETYSLSVEEKRMMQECAYEGKDNIKIDIVGIEKEEKELALAFARSFRTLSDDEKKTMKALFDNR